MNCLNCQRILATDFDFCPTCGQKIVRTSVDDMLDCEFCEIKIELAHPQNHFKESKLGRFLFGQNLVFQAVSYLTESPKTVAQSRLLQSNTGFLNSDYRLRTDFEGNFNENNLKFNESAYQIHARFLAELLRTGWLVSSGGINWYGTCLFRRKKNGNGNGSKKSK